MSAQHTPGPWKAQARGDGWHITADNPTGKVGERLYTRVATVHAMKGYDAKLIEQAPALLDMVRQYASECGECNGTGREVTLTESGDYGPDVDCEQCADIRALVAKAEGGAS